MRCSQTDCPREEEQRQANPLRRVDSGNVGRTGACPGHRGGALALEGHAEQPGENHYPQGAEGLEASG